MVFVSCITLLLLSTVILADYYIDNGNESVVYYMPPGSGQSWHSWSVSTGNENIPTFSNSTGTYTIPLDASNCYDRNYTQGKCGTGDNCYIQIPFTGSGVTIYVFNAAKTGMTAGFSVDGGTAFPGSIAAPTAAENYQVSNVSLFTLQGLPSGNHSIKMTLMDWDGVATDMKFDYAHVNETFVAMPMVPLTPGPPTASNRIDMGSMLGIGLGVTATLGIGIFLLRNRKALCQGSATSAHESFQLEPFTSSSRPLTRHSSSRSSHVRSDENSVISPMMRFAILRNAHAVGNLSTPAPIQRRQSGEGPSAFSDTAIPSQHNLTTVQVETVRGLLADGTPADTITHVIEAFASEANSRHVIPSSEYALSLESPPSYQTQAR